MNLRRFSTGPDLVASSIGKLEIQVRQLQSDNTVLSDRTVIVRVLLSGSAADPCGGDIAGAGEASRGCETDGGGRTATMGAVVMLT